MTKSNLEKCKSSNKGITLIALIITIIVLLILAGVTINALTGSDSAPAKANEAEQKNDIGSAKDQIAVSAINAKTAAYETAYVGNGVSSTDASKTVGQAVIDAVKAKDGKSVGKASISVEQATKNEKLDDATITITTRDFKVIGTITIEDGILTWGEIGPNNGTTPSGGPQTGDVDETQYGLLDDKGNLVASWDSLVNDYFLRIENDYDANDHDDETGNSMSYVLNSNSELSEGTQLVIPSSYTVTTAKKINGQKIASLDSKEYVSDITAVAANTQNSITKIGYNAIANCDKLTSITLPNSVTSIGEGAFSGCSKLESITIPNGVTSISNNAFSYCDMLSSVTIPNGVTSIGCQAFCECYLLTNITIPNTVTYIDSQAFSGLNSVTFKGDVEEINDCGGMMDSDGIDIYFDFDTSNCDVGKYLGSYTRYVYYNKNYGYYGEFDDGSGSALVLDTSYSDDTYVRYKNTYYFENN